MASSVLSDYVACPGVRRPTWPVVRTVEVVSRRVQERAAAQQAAHLVGQLSNLLLLQAACMHSMQVCWTLAGQTLAATLSPRHAPETEQGSAKQHRLSARNRTPQTMQSPSCLSQVWQHCRSAITVAHPERRWIRRMWQLRTGGGRCCQGRPRGPSLQGESQVRHACALCASCPQPFTRRKHSHERVLC